MSELYPPEVYKYLDAVRQRKSLREKQSEFGSDLERWIKICNHKKLIKWLPGMMKCEITGQTIYAGYDYEDLTGKGELALLTSTTNPATKEDHEWSEARSPAEWRKLLGGMSESTMRRRIKEGKLIVDDISTKSWRIRLDSLQRFTGTK